MYWAKVCKSFFTFKQNFFIMSIYGLRLKFLNQKNIFTNFYIKIDLTFFFLEAMQSLLRTRISTINRSDAFNRYYHLSASSLKNKKSSIQELINDISREEKTEKTLNNLVKNVQNKNQQIQERKRKQNEKVKAQQAKMNKFENASSKKGKHFWFPEVTQKVNVEIAKKVSIPNESIDQDDASSQSVNDVKAIKNLGDGYMQNHNVAPVERSNLLSKIENDDSNREVSRLMSAMIDRIDQQSDDVEQNLQKLIKSFSSGNNEDVNRSQTRQKRDFNNKQQRSGSTQRRSPIKTFFDKPTSLFKGVEEFKGIDQDCPVNYFQTQWNENLKELLPQVKPQNAFEAKMLDIDRQWQFPIDNEQDMGIEESTGFDEHVFLDHLLEEFPEEGPVFKFMELVITGLQQNPHLNIEEKTNQVLWFKEYFDKFSDDDLKVANLEF